MAVICYIVVVSAVNRNMVRKKTTRVLELRSKCKRLLHNK
jgi:hypothetical protein